MNIFVLARDPEEAAIYHCNKHVCKMILETGQMLSTAHWILWLEKLGKTRSDFRLVRDMKEYLKENVPKEHQPEWQLTHQNHPCTVWVRSSIANYYWSVRLMRGLLTQYTKRYKKIHKSEMNYKWLNKNPPPNIPNIPLTDHPVCMPEDCKISDSVVKSYRNYYIKHKQQIAVWEPRAMTPPWYKESILDR